MRRLLKETRYEDLHEMESNVPLLKKILISLSPKEFYAFVGEAKKKRTFHEKRSRRYEKLKESYSASAKTSKIVLWSDETEGDKKKSDEKWLTDYETIYDNTIFWYDLWEEKEKTWYSLLKTKPKYSRIVPVEYDVLERLEDGSEIKAMSMDEFFLRSVEMTLLTRSTRKILKNVGKLLLNDERIMLQLKSRNKVENLEVLLECGLLQCFDHKLGDRGSEDNDEIFVSVSDMQNVFYVLETMRRRENYGSEGDSDLVNLFFDPKLVLSRSIPERFPLRSRLYASAFLEAVLSYCNYRCSVKGDAIFLLKPVVGDDSAFASSSTFGSDFLIYDLEHNVVFYDVSLFFKYNVYAFKQNSEDHVFETLCFHDCESETINSCLEFGFENIMESDVLQQLVNSSLVEILPSKKKSTKTRRREEDGEDEDSNRNEDVHSKISRFLEWIRWKRLFKLSYNEMKFVSFIPCAVKSKEDLICGDVDRLKRLREILECRLVGKTLFPDLLVHVLKCFVSDFEDIDARRQQRTDFSSPELLRFFFTKRAFLKLLWAKLDDENTTPRNEMRSLEDLTEFVENKAHFVKFEPLEIDSEDIFKYSDFIDEEELAEVCEEDEYGTASESKSKKRAKRIRSSDLVLDKRRRTTVRAIYEEDENEDLGERNSDDDVPTDYDERNSRSYNESDREEEEEEEIDRINSNAEQKSRKRKRTVTIIVSNVHKDCLLFAKSLFRPKRR